MHTYRMPSEYFRPQGVLEGKHFTTEEFLFSGQNPEGDWHFFAGSKLAGKSSAAVVTAEDVSGLGEFIQDGCNGTNRELFLDKWRDSLGDLEYLVAEDTSKIEPSFGTWMYPGAHGIYRREHANLIVRSATTTIVVDPQHLHNEWTSNGSQYPAEQHSFGIDGILITHSHSDHFHIPSVVARANQQDTRVLLPPCPRVNALCPINMHEACRTLGLLTEEATWWRKTRIGDIAIQVLPFYGEQPTCTAPGAPEGVRNWGAVYRFDMPQGYSLLILVDSGKCPLGNSIDAILQSVDELGPIDVVASCCMRFPEGINPGLPRYQLTLPFAQLQGMYRSEQKESMTLGPEGVATACKAAQARYFLPYAHGFAGIGRPTDVQSDLRELKIAMSRVSGTTEIVGWRPGDAAHWQNGTLEIAKIG